WAHRSAEWGRETRSSEWRLTSAVAFLGDHQAARGGQKDNRNQTFSLQLERSFADDFQVRTGVVHEDETVRIHLRQKTPHLLFTDGHVTVAEQEINLSFDFYFQAGLVAKVNPVLELGRIETLLRFCEDHRVELAGDDAATPVLLQA